MSCSGEGCNSIHIQNKKYNLCGDCVFKKNNGGKSKQEVYSERALLKRALSPGPIKGSLKATGNMSFDSFHKTIDILNNKHYEVDDVSAMNARNQDAAEEHEKIDQGFSNVQGFLNESAKVKDREEALKKFGDPKPEKRDKKKSTPLKRQSVKKISCKQTEINAAYKLTCIDFDYTEEPVCTGCLRYQGGDIKLSHSHVISREDCKRIGREDLISDKDNLRFHCMNFGENEGCHGKWENPTKRASLKDYGMNIKYIKSIDHGLYLKYSSCI